MTFTGKQILTTLEADGTLTVEIADHVVPAPSGSHVVVKVEATPINPSDLALLFASADLEHATYTPGRIVARMPEPATRAMKSRHGIPLPVGNECAGVVVAAGEHPAAQALLGKRIACVPGTSFAQYATADAHSCMPLAEGITAEQGASSFVNPMTVVGFVETMKQEGFTGLVHAAAASNLGQMLVRLCKEDGIPLVSIVRSDAQRRLLEDLGATHVLDSTDAHFMAQLVEAIDATKAMLGFDPIGGGKLAGQILSAMEASASKGATFSRYGSSSAKKVYIYGGLDLGPTILNRAFGLSWGLGGWLLPDFLAKADPQVVGRMRNRVMANLAGTFASHYTAQVSLDAMLTRDAVSKYNARRTGEKYLVLPNG